VIELFISQVGLSAADVQRLKAVMVVIVSNAEVQARWCMGEPNTAHLVLVAPDNAQAQEFVAANGQNSRQVIAALVGESDTVSFACEKLPWPIRLTSLLELLKKVEDRMKTAANAPRTVVTQAPADNNLVRLATLVRGTDHGDKVAWRITGLSDRPMYVAAPQKAFIFEDSLLHLLQLHTEVELDFVPMPLEALPETGQRKPIRMLQWLIGLRTGRLGLLPWIDPDSSFRLRQFPEFQLLHHTAEHRRIAAALSRTRYGISSISEMTEINARIVVSFVNAVSLCGYLKIGEPGAAATAARKISGGTRRALFQVFRKALGIVSADA
jgi:hypothetical protein